jgi:hypothetical protein
VRVSSELEIYVYSSTMNTLLIPLQVSATFSRERMKRGVGLPGLPTV